MTELVAARVPPQNLDAEESILGAIMISPAAVEAVMDIVDPGDFYREGHGTIYRTALRLYANGSPVDAISLADQLAKDGTLGHVGGREKLQELASLVPVASNAAHWAGIVRDVAVARGLITAGNEIVRLGYDRPDDITDLVDQAEQAVYSLSRQHGTGHTVELRDILAGEFARISHLYETGQEITGVPTGFRDIDRATAGLHPGQLIVIAGRPSMGKSALAGNLIATAAVRHEIPVALFTLEMSRGEVAQRLMCAEGRVQLSKLRNGRLDSDDWPRLTRACAMLEPAPIYIDDSGTATIAGIRSRLRRIKTMRPNLGLVVVDYLQLMHDGNARLDQRVQEVSKISRGLKMLAAEFQVPVIALSQLNRKVEERADKRPVLSDLRESGSIEQDADIVVFLYRDEVYYPDTTDARGICEVNIAKQRNGPVSVEKLTFQGRYARFSDLISA